MNELKCRIDKRLSCEEKKAFGRTLQQQGITESIFLVYENLVDRLDKELQLFCIKAYDGDDIAGAAFFMRVQPVDVLSSISALRENAALQSVIGPLTSGSKACAYLCMRSSTTANIMTPLFVREDEPYERVLGAIFAYMKAELGAELIMVMDSSARNSLYLDEGFGGYPCPSEAVLELKGYGGLSEYLGEHRSTRKNIPPKKNVSISFQSGELTPDDLQGISACTYASAVHAKSKMPYGEQYTRCLLESSLYRSSDYLHVIVRVDGVIAGFHSYLPCGTSLGAIAGGFNREASKKSFVYERLIAATVDYAIRNRFERIHYGIVDNQTKQRLMNTFEPNRAYYYIASPVERWMMKITNKHTDIYKLYALEERLKRGTDR